MDLSALTAAQQRVWAVLQAAGKHGCDTVRLPERRHQGTLHAGSRDRAATATLRVLERRGVARQHAGRWYVTDEWAGDPRASGVERLRKAFAKGHGTRLTHAECAALLREVTNG